MITEKIGKWEIAPDHELGLTYQNHVVQQKDNPEILGFIHFQGTVDGEPSRYFLNRIESLKELDHPNILKLLDYDLEAEHPYLVTELCKGGDLRNADLDSWTVQEKMRVHYQLCDAWAYLWDNGIVKGSHDFKNVFLKEDNTPVIGDFETGKPIKRDADGVRQILKQASQMFWQIMEGKDFNRLSYEDERLNEKITDLRQQLQRAEQERARL